MTVRGVIVALACAGVVACRAKASTAPPVVVCAGGLGASVSPVTATMTVGDTLRLSASIAGCIAGSVPNQWHWRSGDVAVASVDSLDGLVTARAAGTDVVTGVFVSDPTITVGATLRVLP